MPESPDIKEDTLRRHSDLLNILLLDRTRSKAKESHNILWGTDSYQNHQPKDEIALKDITGKNAYVIQPRIMKSKDEQKARTVGKAEVFTPPEIVDEMNKQTDWAGQTPSEEDAKKLWPATAENWQNYVALTKLEITCGEAPFIVGRYNAVSGKKVLKLENRVGFLDRKLQVVSEFCDDKTDWLNWAKIAYQNSYGYEWQGDNLLLARENLLYTFIDYYNAKFPDDPINLDQRLSRGHLALLKEFAEIISWNIFQMDGIKFVIPMSCKNVVITEEVPPMLIALGEKPKIIKRSVCTGCKKNDPLNHNGKYVKIMDWKTGKEIKFVDILKPEKAKSKK